MNINFRNIFFILFMLLLIVSCDSLWKVGGTADVSFSVDLTEIIPNAARNGNNARSLDLNESIMLEQGTLIVSLYDAKKNTILQSVTKGELSSLILSSINVVFSDVRIGTEVYASVVIEDPVPLNSSSNIVFNARSESAVLRNATLELVARPYAVFLDPTNTDPETNGLTPYSPVSTIQEAVRILGGTNNRLPGATVYVTSPMQVRDSETWNYPGLTLKAWGTDLDSVVWMYNSAAELTIDGITIDGSGVTNKGINIGSGNVSVRNTTIIGTNQAIFINGGSILELAGGTTRIHANTKNLVYSSGDARVYLSYALGNGSLIGLSPSTGDTATLVIAEDISFLNKNYFFLDSGVPGALSVTPLGLEYNKDGDDGDDGDDGGDPPEPPVVASVFLDPQYTSGNSDGTDTAPYTSMEDAVDAIKNFSVENPTTIYVMNPIPVTSSATWDYPGLTMQLDFDNWLVEMIQVSGSGTTLTLEGLVLDGNDANMSLLGISDFGKVASSNTTIQNTNMAAVFMTQSARFEMTGGMINNIDSSAIDASYSSEITINSGVISVNNSSAISLSSSTLNLYGGTISGTDKGVFLTSDSTLNLYSGNPIIIPEGIEFFCAEDHSDIKLKSDIDINSSIKLLYGSKNPGYMLIQSEGGTIDSGNFVLEDPEYGSHVNVEGHLVLGAQADYYVSSSNALTSVQAAVTAAQSAGSGEKIIMVTGTINENVTIDSGNIKLIGSGTIRGDGSNSVIKVSNAGTVFTLDGPTITGGETSYGGGVYVNEATFNMDSGIITGNTASTGGGGVYSTGGAHITISGGIIGSQDDSTRNTAQFGGGIYAGGASCTITGDAKIMNNTAQQGGGVRHGSGTFTMSGGSISSNTATVSFGGGIYSRGGTSTEISGGIIENNEATTHGGGIAINNNAVLKIQGNPSIKNNEVAAGVTNNIDTTADTAGPVGSISVVGNLNGDANSIGITIVSAPVVTGNDLITDENKNIFFNDAGASFTLTGGNLVN